jgi:hypothetical protein
VKVKYATSDGTARTKDKDYKQKSKALTFKPGETQKTISVSVRGDTKPEQDETFFVDLSEPQNATIDDGHGVGTILTDDVPVLSIGNVQQSEGNSGTTALIFEVKLSGPSSQTVTVRADTADGSAGAPGDYTAVVNQTVTFNPGQTSRTLSVQVKGDTDVEPDETFAVNLTNPNGATCGGGDCQAQGTINNDDGPGGGEEDPLPSVSIADASVQEGQAGTKLLTFTISLSAVTNKNVEVDWVTGDDTAAAGSDYVAANGTLEIKKGNTSGQLSVTINGDADAEPNEQLLVNLSNPKNAFIGDGQAIGTIQNDDNQAPTATAQSDLTTDEETAELVTLAGTDPENDPLSFKIASLPANGKLFKGNSTAGADEITTVPTTLPGTQVTYLPNVDHTGADSFTFRAADAFNDSAAASVGLIVNNVNDAPKVDLNGGGSGLSNTQARTIDVSATNDAPVLADIEVADLTYQPGDPAAAITASITIADVASPTLASATVQVTSNCVGADDVLSFADTAGISSSYNSSNCTLTLTGPDTRANFQTALRNVKFANNNGSTSTAERTVTFQVNDGGAASNTQTRDIQIQLNTLPVLADLEGGALAFTEGNGPTSITAGLTVADTDTPTLLNATVQITGNYQNGEDVLSFADAAPISGSWDATSGTMTLSGAGTPAQYQAALRNVKYDNTSNTPNTATRTATFLTFQTGTLSANNGVGLQFDNADGTYNVNGTTALNGADAGVDILNGSSGTFTFSTSTSIGATTSPSGVAVNIQSSNAAVDYNGTISKTSSGRVIDIRNRTGGTVTFDGQVTCTTSCQGIFLDNNDNSTITFTGGLNLSTGVSDAFTATNGGTFSATQNNSTIVNTLTTTTGTALNVANTTIGASGLTFRSISANGAANGIVLNATGSIGGLTVSGNSSGSCGGSVGSGPPASAATATAPDANDCTGGVIQNTTGAGIVLTSTRDVSLTRIRVTGSGDDGIQGTSVTNFTLASSLIENNGNANGEANLDFGDVNDTTPDGLFGAASITSSTIRNSPQHNVSVRNQSGTLSMTVTDSQFTNISANTSSEDGLLFGIVQTGSVTVNVQDSYFAANRADHFQAAASNSADLDVTFKNNTLVGGHSTALGQGITINAATGVAFGGYSGRVDYDLDGNHINGAISYAINVVLGTSGAGAAFDGFIRNNRIGTAGVALSCSTQASGIGIDASGNGTHTASVTGNTIRRCYDRGVYLEANDGNGAANVTITGNTVTELTDTNNTDGTPREAFHANIGSTSTNVFGQIDSHAVCLHLSGNTLTGGANKPADIRTRQRFRTSVRLPGYGGTAFDVAAVDAFLSGNNGGASSNASANNDATVTTDGYFGGAACATPS